MAAKPCVVALCALIASTSWVEAQTRRPSMLPAETPPADFAETHYVDSRGCAFVRAAFNGQTTWLPQLDSDREPLCGLAPSLFAEAAAPGRVVSTRPDPETPADTEAAATAPTEPADDPETEPAAPEIETADTEAPAPASQDVAAEGAKPAAPPEQAPSEQGSVGQASVGQATTGVLPSEVSVQADPDSPVVIIAAGQRRAEPRHRLTVIERRGTIIEVPPDPRVRSVLTVIEQRGQLFYPDT